MDTLEPIPIPPHVKRKEFCERRLPLLVFCAACCLAVVLWRKVGLTPTLPGIGEGGRAAVMSPLTGWLSEVLVQPYQVVKKGDPLAVIRPVDPGAQLDLMRMEMEIARLRQQPTMQEQNAVSYERARLECLRLRSELAIARAKLDHAEKEVDRSRSLLAQKLVSDQAYELVLRERDVYKAEVVEKDKSVAEMENRLGKMRLLADPFLPAPATAASALADRMDRDHENVRTNWMPSILRAPIDGMTGNLSRSTDEFVFEGETIVTINALQSERIIGYVRQPYSIDPELGMKVSVATRTKKRSVFFSRIVQLGAQCEYITNALALARQYNAVDIGLPIVVEVPPGVRIRPGEQLDLILHPGEILQD